MRSAVIPVAGLVRNLNTLLGQHGIAGLKTGSGSAAGECVLPTAWRDVRGGGNRVLIVAAVLGQPGTAETILPSALGAGRQLMLSLNRALQPGRGGAHAITGNPPLRERGQPTAEGTQVAPPG
jgi:hypothetical protein